VNFHQVVAELTAERDQIDRAIAAIEGLNSTGRRRLGRPPSATRKRRTFSAATRARIAAAQRARWAKAKQAQASKPVRRMSAAARRKLSRLLKQRWAQGKMKPRAKKA
jgi:hypothetical protein